MKVLGARIEKGKNLKCIVESTACFIEERGNGFCVRLTTAHPSISYFIIGADKVDDRHYRMLKIEEAERMIDSLVGDVVALEHFGDYQICLQETTQTVYIRNDINEYDDKEIPIYTKNIDD